MYITVSVYDENINVTITLQINAWKLPYVLWLYGIYNVISLWYDVNITLHLR